MKVKTIILPLLSSFLLFSTAYRFDTPVDVCYVSQEENWPDVFTNWWLAMNENYAFWFLDSPSSQWDEVYDTYLPLFQEMGAIDKFDAAETSLALQYFYEIIIGAGNMDESIAKSDFMGLSDMHYTLYLSLDGIYSISPRSHIKASQLGVSPEVYFDMVLRGDASNTKIEYDTENFLNIHNAYFTLSDDGTYEDMDFAETSKQELFNDAYCMSQSGMAMFLGLTEDRIAYLSFNQFKMTEIEENMQFRRMMEKFEEILSI